MLTETDAVTEDQIHDLVQEILEAKEEGIKDGRVIASEEVEYRSSINQDDEEEELVPRDSDVDDKGKGKGKAKQKREIVGGIPDIRFLSKINVDTIPPIASIESLLVNSVDGDQAVTLEPGALLATKISPDEIIVVSPDQLWEKVLNESAIKYGLQKEVVARCLTISWSICGDYTILNSDGLGWKRIFLLCVEQKGEVVKIIDRLASLLSEKRNRIKGGKVEVKSRVKANYFKEVKLTWNYTEEEIRIDLLRCIILSYAMPGRINSIIKNCSNNTLDQFLSLGILPQKVVEELKELPESERVHKFSSNLLLNRQSLQTISDIIIDLIPQLNLNHSSESLSIVDYTFNTLSSLPIDEVQSRLDPIFARIYITS